MLRRCSVATKMPLKAIKRNAKSVQPRQWSVFASWSSASLSSNNLSNSPSTRGGNCNATLNTTLTATMPPACSPKDARKAGTRRTCLPAGPAASAHCSLALRASLRALLGTGQTSPKTRGLRRPRRRSGKSHASETTCKQPPFDADSKGCTCRPKACSSSSTPFSRRRPALPQGASHASPPSAMWRAAETLPAPAARTRVV
mmetsp:Transcript_172862/g.554213  ORF Transcript_172862/g.554213 Transcript_172862/m.554213 type:complete len:201 (-) Transcript_172862:24-626(-)